ncbi:hypothetical protein [Streptomyces sp. NPDC052042]|uniref:hypothetical protein n=1 Tax=Streptomyces sp. NPDC052042 TaxID=3365683 RepID=UPI0037CCEFBF
MSDREQPTGGASAPAEPGTKSAHRAEHGLGAHRTGHHVGGRAAYGRGRQGRPGGEVRA